MEWLQKGLNRLKKRGASAGIDVSRHYVKAVEISHAQDKQELLGCHLATLKINEGEKGLIGALKGIIAGLKSKSALINIGIAGDSVITRHVDMPVMSDANLRNALKYEAQKYMLSKDKPEDLITDFHKLPEVKNQKDKQRIIFVAAKRQYLTEYLNLFKKAGIEPTSVDANAFGLINCFNFNQPQTIDNQSIVLLNIDYELVNMSILEGKVPYFTRDITLEEGEWANLILEKLDEFLLFLDRDSGNQATTTENFQAIRPLLTHLSREVKLSINYYESQFEKSVKKIYISGEVTRSRDALNFFSEQLGMGVEVWDPFAKVVVNPQAVNWERGKKARSVFALAMGLALRS